MISSNERESVKQIQVSSKTLALGSGLFYVEFEDPSGGSKLTPPGAVSNPQNSK